MTTNDNGRVTLETLRAATHDDARKLLAGRPDVVFDELVTLDIEPQHIELWRGFAAEWGGTLHLMDEMNRRRMEERLIDETDGEFISRTYRLGTVVLSGLYDRLALRQAAGGEANGPFRYAMNALDCYFVPAYLDDYGRMHAERKADCRRYVDAVRALIADEAPLEAAAASLQAVVQEYIRNLHHYAAMDT